MKKRIISALLAFSMVVALPLSTVLADEDLPLDNATSGQETSVPETPVEGNENTVEDVTTETPTEETPYDETEVSKNEAENNLVATYADELTYGDLSYKIENNQITITGCNRSAVSVDIPAEIDGIPVTSIGYEAFIGCDNLTSVTIPNSITSIGSFAFSACYSLTSITIPSSITSIGSWAFDNCQSLTSITIPNSVTSINEFTFNACLSLTSITISDSVTSIGRYAFENCTSLTSITIPDSVTSIGYAAFASCTSLTNLNISNNNLYYSSVNGVLFNKNKTTLLCCPRSNGEYTIPNGVTSIDSGAFEYCRSLTSIIISDSVTSIGAYAFYSCENLTSITIPNSVTFIGYEAFKYCESLTDVYYAGSESDWKTINIGSYNYALLDANIHYNSTGPDETTEPDGESFFGTLRITDGCKIIWQAYYKPDGTGQPKNVNLTIAVVNADDTEEELYLYNEAVEGGSPFPWELEPYNIPKSAITELAILGKSNKKLCTVSGMFKDYTNLREATLTNVAEISSDTFNGCKNLQDVFSYDSSPKVIGSRAFRNCTMLQRITLGKETMFIGENAFQNCKNLSNIMLEKEVKTIGKDAFDGCNIVIRCYYQSAAHKYAEENDIEFWLIDPQKTLLPFYSSSGVTYWDIDWSWDLFNLPSTKYDSRLAALGASLSAATEKNINDAENVLHHLDFDKIKSCSYYTEGLFSPAVTFGYKKVEGTNEHILVVAVRGSTTGGDFVTDVLPFGFDISKAHTAYDLGEFMKECGIKDADIKNNGKIYITGHSLGGAVSNLLAKDLTDKFGVNRVYSYTFASPKTSNLIGAGGYLNIHNIANDEDDVRNMGGGSTRYGMSYKPFNLVDMRTNQSFCNTFKKLTGKEIWQADPMFLLGMHHVEIYAAYAFEGYNPQMNIKNGKIIKVKCPVDVEIYDSSNQLLGKIINNVCSDAIDDDMIYFYVEDNAKYIDIVDDGDYTIKLTGTDTGTMDYTVYEVNMGTNETVTEKSFKNVSLSNGKKFTSYVSIWDKTDLTINSSGKVDTPEVPLYVIDDNGTPEKEVLPDGNGTEVQINNNNTPITPVAPNRPATPDNGGSSSNTNTSADTVSPVGGTNTESMTIKIDNKITGKTSKIAAKKTGNSVIIKLGTENNGYYANVYTTDDEYICSALIENGKAEFNVPDGIKIKIVIDSIAYGEDVSSAAGINATDDNSQSPLYMIVIIIAIAVVGFSSIIIAKRFAKKKH